MFPAFTSLSQPIAYRTFDIIDFLSLFNEVARLGTHAVISKVANWIVSILAFYDPPWIFPWLKRHEIWLLASVE